MLGVDKFDCALKNYFMKLNIDKPCSTLKSILAFDTLNARCVTIHLTASPVCKEIFFCLILSMLNVELDSPPNSTLGKRKGRDRVGMIYISGATNRSTIQQGVSPMRSAQYVQVNNICSVKCVPQYLCRPTRVHNNCAGQLKSSTHTPTTNPLINPMGATAQVYPDHSLSALTFDPPCPPCHINIG